MTHRKEKRQKKAREVSTTKACMKGDEIYG
jgi:hypothetical protein